MSFLLYEQKGLGLTSANESAIATWTPKKGEDIPILEQIEWEPPAHGQRRGKAPWSSEIALIKVTEMENETTVWDLHSCLHTVESREKTAEDAFE